MRRLAHISDLHFGRTDARVVEALVDELNADGPDLIIASGDFTQDGRREEFAEARAFMARLKAPWIAVPGNHDITAYDVLERFFDPYRRFRRAIHPEIEPVWCDAELAVVGVNTARRMAPELNWSYGRINRRQIAWVERQFAAMPKDRFRIVVAHHPFLPPPWKPDARLTKRSEAALAVFERIGVGLVLAGHLHRGYARFLEPVIARGAVAEVVEQDPMATATRRLLCVQAGSATSTRLRDESNAYNRIVIEGGHATVEARVWTGDAWFSARAAEAVTA